MIDHHFETRGVAPSAHCLTNAEDYLPGTLHVNERLDVMI